MSQSVSKNGGGSLPARAGAGSEEVVARPTRRRFTAEYKLRILQEAERCAPGFGDRDDRVVAVVQALQVRNLSEHTGAERQEPHVGEHDWAVRVRHELRG